MALGKGRAAPGALGLIALLVAATLPMHAHAELNLNGSGDEVEHTPSSGTTKLTISAVAPTIGLPNAPPIVPTLTTTLVLALTTAA